MDREGRALGRVVGEPPEKKLDITLQPGPAHACMVSICENTLYVRANSSDALGWCGLSGEPDGDEVHRDSAVFVGGARCGEGEPELEVGSFRGCAK